MSSHIGVRTLFAAIALTTVSAAALADHPNVTTNWGSPVHGPATIEREILIKPDTKWVNVLHDQTVRFVIQSGADVGKSFVWRFDTLGTPVIELNRLAPAGLLGERPIEVYIAHPWWHRG